MAECGQRWPRGADIACAATKPRHRHAVTISAPGMQFETCEWHPNTWTPWGRRGGGGNRVPTQSWSLAGSRNAAECGGMCPFSATLFNYPTEFWPGNLPASQTHAHSPPPTAHHPHTYMHARLSMPKFPNSTLYWLIRYRPTCNSASEPTRHPLLTVRHRRSPLRLLIEFGTKLL